MNCSAFSSRPWEPLLHTHAMLEQGPARPFAANLATSCRVLFCKSKDCEHFGVQALATRAHSQSMLNVLEPVLPGLIGGSADLAPSNLTIMKVCESRLPRLVAARSQPVTCN